MAKIYCDNRNCTDDSCIRHLSYAPLGVVVKVCRYNKNKKGFCKEYLDQWDNSLQEVSGQMRLELE